MYEISSHKHTDRLGKTYSVEIFTEDGTVVFNSTPPLLLDVYEFGIKLKRKSVSPYTIAYTIKDSTLYLTRLYVFSKTTPEIFGVKPQKLFDSDILTYEFDNIPTDYSGTLTVGRNFDMNFWPKDDYANEVPFSPEVYKENGHIILENGKVADIYFSHR